MAKKTALPTRTRGRKMSVWLTEKEYTSIKENIEASGLSMTEYVLARCIYQKGRITRFDAKELLRPFRNAIVELSRQGNNFNQIARVLNTYSESSLPKGLLEDITATIIAEESRRQKLQDGIQEESRKVVYAIQELKGLE
jgi:hypothetical protein